MFEDLLRLRNHMILNLWNHFLEFQNHPGARFKTKGDD